jgi:hypothetical protein
MSYLQKFEPSDTSVINFKIKFEPFVVQNVYISNSNAKTFEDVMNEAPELLRRNDDWLRRNIRDSLQRNADIWSELAKY